MLTESMHGPSSSHYASFLCSMIGMHVIARLQVNSIDKSGKVLSPLLTYNLAYFLRKPVIMCRAFISRKKKLQLEAKFVALQNH